MKIGAQISPVPQRWNHHYRLTNPVPQEKLQEKLSARTKPAQPINCPKSPSIFYL
jgi:hypothetical protein